MPEIIPIGNSSESDFVITAITKAGNISEVVANGIPGRGAEVCFTVNGVEVPFAETIKDIFARCQAKLDEDAAKIVLEKFDTVMNDNLGKLNDLFEDFRREIKRKVEEIFKVELNEDD